jgi:hypothetical protein
VKAESTGGTAKRGESDSNKKRREPELKAATDLLALNAVQSAAPAPVLASRPEAVGGSTTEPRGLMTPAAVQTASAAHLNSNASPLHTIFESSPAPKPNKSEPPVAFVLELKPNEKADAGQSTAVQMGQSPAAEPLPAIAPSPTTAGKLVPTDAVEQKTAPEIKVDATPAIGRAGMGLDNHRDEASGQDRTKQSPDHERQSQRDAQLTAGSEPARLDAPFKPDLSPVGVNQRPHSQTESIQESPGGAESIGRPAAVISSTEKPKAGPIREISFQSSSPEAGAVKVQVIDRGGDVRISVRSADPNLTHALQRDVGQLVTKLDHSGYEAKAWNPRETTSLAGIAESRDVQIRPEAGSNSNNSGSDSGSRGGQGGAHDQSQQQRRHGDARQWTNTLDDSVRRTITEDEEEIWQA